MLDLIIITSHPAGLLFYLDQQSLLLVRVTRRRMTGNLTYMYLTEFCFFFFSSSYEYDYVGFLHVLIELLS
jgi:hypothetical protein